MHDIGMVEVVLNGATPVPFNWQDPGTINAAAPTQVELEWAPDDVFWRQRVAGGTPGAAVVTGTATGGTITGTAGDTSTVRIKGVLYSNGRPSLA